MKSINEFDYKKAIQALNFFAAKEGGSIDKMKALKLIWLADRYHLRKYGRPITNDRYFAMEFGPVASTVKDLIGFNMLGKEELSYLSKYLKKKNDNTITVVKKTDSDVFSQTDIEAFEVVYSEYGEYKPIYLSRISHKFPEWLKHEEILKSKVSLREDIKYSDFFENPKEKISEKNIFTESKEELNYAKSVFNENVTMACNWL
ncbi:SocA family protein [Candidatus Parcubacteria bacterium]|nr:SocA family protein [Candidatus Parcubacteria bacterium]